MKIDNNMNSIEILNKLKESNFQDEKLYSQLVSTLKRDENIDDLIIKSTIEGYEEWLTNEIIIQSDLSKKEMSNCSLVLKEDAKLLLKDYVYPKLKKNGLFK